MNVVRSLNRLLRLRDDPLDFQASASLLVGAAICAAIYAAAAGFFQGGSSIAIAALKVPLIIFGSLVLCLPSLYIFTALAGVEISIREFAAAVAGFSGIVGLILLALMPVTWLFAVSTMSLGFVVLLHLFIWITALVFGRRIIVKAIGPARGAVGLWLVLLFLVSLQLTTYMRPVLWHATGTPLLELEKQSFFSHYAGVLDFRPPSPPALSTRGLKPLAPAAAVATPPLAPATAQSR